MGEIKIKSENLFDINGEHTSTGWDGKKCLVIENDTIIVNQIRPGYMTGIYYDKEYKEGTYTLIIQVDSFQFINKQTRLVSSAPFLGGAWNESYQSYTADMNKQDALHYISFTVNEPTKIGFFINGHFSVNDKLYDIQLLKGTYTSETIPEYQPYFLNRPAHQVTNGQWVDIPTHHYTNGRWQGELTSQSPLKFRADGEMLDWRIEGRKSGNLFDVKHFVDTAYCHNVVLTQLDNGIRIQATASNDPYANYVNGVIGQTLPIDMRSAVISCKPNTDYTLHCVQSSRIGKYLSYFDKDYKVVKNYTPFSGTSLNFKTPETCVFILLRLGDRSTLSEGTIVELANIQILEGTYTADTLPPYEPYGGVGDWDETAQKYKIPVNVRGNNLYSSAWEQGFWAYDTGAGWGTDSKYARTAKMPCEGNTKYEFVCSLPDGSKDYGFVFWDTNGNYIDSIYSSDVQNTPVKYFATSPANAKMMAVNIARYSDGERHPVDILGFDLYELHETNLYTDHQLLDGDSIDFATDQTAIPIATGNNTLSVDTAVQPSKVVVKFEG